MKLGSLLSVTCRHRSEYHSESLQMDSEGRIIGGVVLGTEFSNYDRRTGDNKTSHKTGACS